MLLGGIAVLPTLMRPIVNCYRPCSMVCWSVCPPVSPSVRRAGSVWIFQFRFDSVQFSVSSTLFQFFGFGIRIPLQCNSIPERENTKTELINIHGKFPSKYIDRPCRVWRSYSHSVSSAFFTAHCNARIASAVLAIAIPSVCLSVCPSVCLSRASIVSKRRHVARCGLCCWIAKCV